TADQAARPRGRGMVVLTARPLPPPRFRGIVTAADQAARPRGRGMVAPAARPLPPPRFHGLVTTADRAALPTCAGWVAPPPDRTSAESSPVPTMLRAHVDAGWWCSPPAMHRRPHFRGIVTAADQAARPRGR